MDWANIAFNSPQKIKLNETAQIELRLSLQKSIEELGGEIAAAGAREGARVRVSNRMVARLKGSGFNITAITSEEQAIGTIDTAEWKWEIKPTAPGLQRLSLILAAQLRVDGTNTSKDVKTFEKTIEVEVTAGQQVSDFLGKYWQWLWAAIFLPIGGWVWKRWKGKIGASE